MVFQTMKVFKPIWRKIKVCKLRISGPITCSMSYKSHLKMIIELNRVVQSSNINQYKLCFTACYCIKFQPFILHLYILVVHRIRTNLDRQYHLPTHVSTNIPSPGVDSSSPVHCKAFTLTIHGLRFPSKILNIQKASKTIQQITANLIGTATIATTPLKSFAQGYGLKSKESLRLWPLTVGHGHGPVSSKKMSTFVKPSPTADTLW